MLCGYMGLCKSFVSNEDNAENFDWAQAFFGEELIMRGERISKNKIQKAVHKLSAYAFKILRDKLLFGLPYEQIANSLRLESVEEKRGLRETGHSFLKNTNLTRLKDTTLLKIAGLTRFQTNYLLADDGNFILNQRKMGLYLKDAWKFQQVMLTLMHLISGQPARATELATLKICNVAGNARSLYLYESQIMTVINYNKTTSRTGQERNIARFLPKKESMAFTVYLMIVRHFERLVL